MFLGNALGGTVNTLNISYVPQFLLLSDIFNISRLTVTDQGGGVICDLDFTGLQGVDIVDTVATRVSSVQDMLYKVPLATALIPDRTCQVRIDMGGSTPANDIVVYADSIVKTGGVYIKTMPVTVLANTQAVFENFKSLNLQNLNQSGDYIVIESADGCVNRFEQEEIPTLLAQLQGNSLNVGVNRIINNATKWVKRVTVFRSFATNITVYTQRYAS